MENTNDSVSVYSNFQPCKRCNKQIDLTKEYFVIEHGHLDIYCEVCGEQVNKEVGYIDHISCSFCHKDVIDEKAYYHRSKDGCTPTIMCEDCFATEIEVYLPPHVELLAIAGWKKVFKKYKPGAFKILDFSKYEKSECNWSACEQIIPKETLPIQ